MKNKWVGSFSNQSHLYLLICFFLNEKQMWGWFVLKPITFVFTQHVFESLLIFFQMRYKCLMNERLSKTLNMSLLKIKQKNKIHILNSLFFSCLSVIIYCTGSTADQAVSTVIVQLGAARHLTRPLTLGPSPSPHFACVVVALSTYVIKSFKSFPYFSFFPPILFYLFVLFFFQTFF
jgi:hypothetical protein